MLRCFVLRCFVECEFDGAGSIIKSRYKNLRKCFLLKVTHTPVTTYEVRSIEASKKRMGKINRFEDLNCWKKARELENEVFKLTTGGAFTKDFGLKDQINRAAGSMMDNIAEGFGRGSKQEFINYLIYAIGSANEVKSQLYRGVDRNYIDQATFDRLYDKTDHAAKMMVSLIRSLKKDNTPGLRSK